MSEKVSGRQVLEAFQQGIANQASSSVEGLALMEILSALKKFHQIKNWKSAVGFVVRQTIYVYLILLIKNYLHSKDTKESLFSRFSVRSLLDRYYKTVIYYNFAPGERDFWQSQPKSCRVRGLEVLVESRYSNELSYELSYIPYLHQGYIDQLVIDRDEAINRHNEAPRKQNCYYSHNGNSYIEQLTTKLYPSSNYREMTDRVRRFLLSCLKTGNRKPLGILVNGPPGLGKTEFARYLPKEVACNCFRINVSDRSFVSLSVTQMLEKLWVSKVTIQEPVKTQYSSDKPGIYDEVTPSVIFIDELDKWAKFSADHDYENQMNVFRLPLPVTTTSDGAALPSNPPPSLDEIKRRRARELAIGLLSVLERDNRSQPTIIVFCSNNFSSMFDMLDESDRMHLAALNDRFVSIEFRACDRTELCNFIRFHNDLYVGTELHCPDIEQHIVRLRPDILFTYRRLSQIMIREQYELEAAVRAFNQEPNFIPETRTTDIFGQKLTSVLYKEIEDQMIGATSGTVKLNPVLTLADDGSGVGPFPK